MNFSMIFINKILYSILQVTWI